MKVCRICRAYLEKLFLKGQKCYTERCPLERRPYPPGQHGGRKKLGKKRTEYEIRLEEKQKLKKMFFMSEEQFRRFFNLALKERGNTGRKFLELLERRLDNVIFRSGLASSRRQARQIVSHGHVKVNGKKVDIPSYIVDVGDEIEVSVTYPREVKQPGWIEIEDSKIKILRLPQKEDLDFKIDENLIVEFYSR